MKKSNFQILVFAIIFILNISMLSAAITNLSHTRRECSFATVTPFGDQVLAVWGERDGVFNLYYAWYTNGKWTAARRVFATSGNSEFPKLAVDSNGRVHMSWMEGSSSATRDIYHASFRNGIWSSRQRVLYTPGNSCWSWIAVRQNNTIDVVWSDKPANDNKYDIRHNWKNEVWNSRGLNVSRSTTVVSIHPACYARGNTVYSCWMQGYHSHWDIYYAQYGGGSNWSTPISVSGAKYGWYPDMAVDSKGNVHILFSNPSRVYLISRIDGEWLNPKAVPGSGQKKSFVSLDVDVNDVLHGAWLQVKDGNTNPYYASADSNGNWTQPVPVSNSNDCNAPEVRADDKGYVHIVWIDHDVYYSRLESGGGGSSVAPIAIISLTPEAGKPPHKVYFDGSDSYDPDGEIREYRWEFGDKQKATGVTTTHTYHKRGTYKVTLTVVDDYGFTGSAHDYVYVSDPPKAKFTMIPSRGVAPLRVSFDASESYDPDGTIKKYTWYFGDDNESTANGKKVSHLYPDPGEFTVVLEVIDNLGISAVASKYLEVLPVHPPRNVRYSFKTNRNLFTKEYLFDITWEKNPLNEQNGVIIMMYRIYRRIKGPDPFVEIKVVKSDTFSYCDRNLQESDGARFEYAVTAVDVDGNESLIEIVDSQQNQSEHHENTKGNTQFIKIK